ncbi:phage baseplate assembly protein V [Brevundimonas sp. SGAir0440]|uniref:phage baseplate assembly protein V n=1 Tax=Brevundimonas sp. SGAir0440 TaxID=2579977 RepID=UPI0010CD316F|nr:phage baseplate assembly protein V [Brevundimonas sp. SGAir0440]QCQ98538.1 hypothetical protein E7T10_07580 [Brevundimonas sp. SGAir0440]
MSNQLTNSVLGRVAQQQQTQGQPRAGTVASYDPKTFLAKVMIEPDGILTGWLPISTVAVGSGAMRVAPTVGDQCLVVPQEGDSGSLVITGFIHSQSARPPQKADSIRGNEAELKSGEGLWVGPRGQFVRMNADGSVLMKADKINLEGDLHVTGDVTVEGKATVDGDVTSKSEIIDVEGKLSDLRENYNNHLHPTGGAGSKFTLKTTKPD